MGTIRSAALHDLPGAYRVCLLTGHAGQDASALYHNPDLLGHVFVGPYIAGQPELAFVIVDRQGVAGYVVGTQDTRAFEAWAEQHWWPSLRRQYPLATSASADDDLIRLIHQPPRATEAVLARFPAHMHIDLLERVRGQGYGRRLVDRLLERLRERGTSGVHLEVDVRNESAIGFYRHLGFDEVERSPGSLTMGLKLG